MSDLILRFEKPQQVLKMSKPQLTLRFPKCPSTIPADFLSYLTLLPSYANDEEAIADGLTTNDPYWLSATTDIGTYNTLKRVSPL